MKPFHTIAVPHQDILDGRLTMDVFAADLWEVFKGRGPEEYREREEFFKKTYKTEGLNTILTLVEKRLKGRGGDPIIQIQTPFGGGKTHSLIAMYHQSTEWKANPVVIVGTALRAEETPWEQIETQLTGKVKYLSGLVAPGREALRKVLEERLPVLLLMDEVLEYITKAATVKIEESTLAAQTVAFMQELTEVISTLDKACLVVSLPSSIIEHYDDRAETFFQQLQKVSGRLEKIYTPVQEHEITEVIRRRLFSRIVEKEAREEIGKFIDYAEREGILPPGVEKSEYRKRFQASYPFLPEVVDILYHRWGSFPSFQRTRGVLRLLSLVVHSLKDKPLPYISLADFDLANHEIRTELLKHIGTEFNSIISNDITGPEAGSKRVDDELGDAYKGLKLGTRASTTIFLYSHSGGVEKGANLGEIKRNATTTENPSSVVAEAAELLKSKLFFLQSEGGKYFFTNKPNLNRIILTKTENISESECIETEKELLRKNLSGQKFKVYIWPKDDIEVADSADLKLVILKDDDENFRKKILENRGNNRRVNRNTVFFLSPISGERSSFYSTLRKLKAYESIPKDETLNLTKEQKKEIKEKTEEIKERVKESIRRYYRLVYVPIKNGFKDIDLGIPTYGATDTIDSHVYNELRSQGDVLESIAPLVIKERYLKQNTYASTIKILQSSLRTPGEIRLINDDVLKNAIRDGVSKGIFGLGEFQNGKPLCKHIGEKVEVTLCEPEIIIRDEVFTSKITKPTHYIQASAEGHVEKGGREISEVQGTESGFSASRDRLLTELSLNFSIPKGQVSSIMGLVNFLHIRFKDVRITIEAKNGTISEEDYENKILETLSQLGIKTD